MRFEIVTAWRPNGSKDLRRWVLSLPFGAR